ncbi:MAG: hypothetical protein H6Q90_6889, partial [Deltaproteobacteria bacterium]|nr:hypothetical protein [Deltaproteobacteria bacterium]
VGARLGTLARDDRVEQEDQRDVHRPELLVSSRAAPARVARGGPVLFVRAILALAS